MPSLCRCQGGGVGAASAAFMTAPEGPRSQTGLEGNATEKARWHAAAKAQGKTFNVWARQILDGHALGRTAGIPEPADAEFAEAMAFLHGRYPVKDRSELLRMAVLKSAERERLLPGSAFKVDVVAGGATPTDAAGSPPRTRAGR
jgi:hypothetical protein